MAHFIAKGIVFVNAGLDTCSGQLHQRCYVPVTIVSRAVSLGDGVGGIQSIDKHQASHSSGSST